MRQGTFIVIEGTDGSGKSTQYALLKEHLERDGHDVVTIKFPRYDEPSSYFVREYLGGAYGSADEVGPYTASLFYALDRYQASFEIRKALAAGKIVLCDRFTPANMAHQGTKFAHAEQRRGYFIWLDNIEYEILGIPRPSLTLVLHTPIDTVLERLRTKIRSSDHITKDVHEADSDHIRKSLEVYLELCRLFPRDFTQIDCTRNGKDLTIQEVSVLIWEKIAPLLPIVPLASTAPKPSAAIAAPPIQESDNPYVEKEKKGIRITEAGREFLKDIVTDPDGSVYAFNGTLSPMTVAAAMARLSRRGDDMRITILDEFAATMDKDRRLLQRVITAYGDDSVQQLAGIHVVVENTTKYLTNKLEWGRLAAYLEQSTRYIYFDERNAAGEYRYYVPEDFTPEVRAAYTQHMDAIFDKYSHMVRTVTAHLIQASDTPKEERDAAWKAAIRAQACDAARLALPAATTTTVGIYASGQALESLVMHLLADDMPEARKTGQAILEQARQVMPVFLERADKPDRGGATIAYRANTYHAMQQLAEEYLPDYHAAEAQAVTLTDCWPHNELDLVPDMLYEHSNLPLTVLRQKVDGWPYDQKIKVLQTYMGERLNRRHRPGRALEKAHYSWDLVCDFGTFCDLMRHRMVDDMEWQELTPRYGYEVPQLIEDAGLVDEYQDCFDISLRLYSYLQHNGHALKAQYATLLGHRMRWKVTYNAREAFHLHELRTSPQGHPLYRKLVQEMHMKLAEVHPLLAEHMRFVNKSEDPALSRLAAERYTQFKLSQLTEGVQE